MIPRYAGEALPNIVKTLYNPDGTIRSYLTCFNDHYCLYSKSMYSVNFTMAQLNEILELLQSPIVKPNLEELQEY